MTADYKDTVFLPKTAFGMKAGLPQLEPKLLGYWKTLDLYERLRRESAGRQRFILHDGPPYANGDLHIGHALNKVLKDVIVRANQMRGRDAVYVPGWDCHGLPIEWKVEENYRKAGRNKDDVDVIEFRGECREFAAHWIGKQSEQFQRLGVQGDWAKPYTTMSFDAEAQIVAELGKFLMNGGLYKGAKPVLWSVVEKTALAEAEVEYMDHESTMVWLGFPVDRPAHDALAGARVVIWTTTPWTLPGNRAVAYGPDFSYAVIEVTEVGHGALADPYAKLVCAEDLLEDFTHHARIDAYRVIGILPGTALEGTVLKHPLHKRGFGFPVPMLPAGFVTVEQGTGFVHIAPGHGEDDWYLARTHGIPVPNTVDDGGLYYDDVPMFAGKHVFKVAPDIIAAMSEAGALMATDKLLHSYPHSWRSKKPLIFRNTPQWFISMSENGLREIALAGIDATRFVPDQGRNRIRSMVESRPDWCVSRQRAWGVPITVFVDRATGEPLRDKAVFDRIVEAVRREGCDVWFTADPADFLAPDYDPAQFDKVTDILDVWFDSGASFSYVLEPRNDLAFPADLYLEGSDQHRGWFMSSLMVGCGTRGHPPYKAVLTHGFTLDEHGRKMSKSLGNVVAPQKVWDDMGADILRLWVMSTDYTEDQRIGPEILKQTGDAYRRLRNTLRFVLGNLHDFDETERLDPAGMPELDRFVLHRLHELNRALEDACDNYTFHHFFRELHEFCAVDLSAFYFDVRKDALYCDAPESRTRRAARTVLDRLFHCLTRWLAPFLCFTAEEAWLARYPAEAADAESSVHLQGFPDIPGSWGDAALAAKWADVRRVRRVVTGALEKKRAEKAIGASLQAAPEVYLPDALLKTIGDVPMQDICITSDIVLKTGTPPPDAYRLDDVPGVAVVVQLAEGEKCQRCWKVLPGVGTHGFDGVCGRCAEAVAQIRGVPAI